MTMTSTPTLDAYLLDTSVATLTLLRAEYDVAAAQAKIRTAGLPEPLAARLAAGR